ISGNDGALAGGLSQLGARDAYTLICVTNFSGSSSVDAVIIMTPGMTVAMAEIREPHTGQNRRVIGWPLPPFFLNSVSLPVIDTEPSGTASTDEWPVLPPLRQSSQSHLPL